ncbi:hypothetical protein ACQ5SO_17280 [Rhodovulum sp. DZ06]|uniref:hypothetical protein n=1 Tax=Rhodovulum sp. DZ06 TaxID=3425126 RepID=UPI003D325884
MTEPLIVIARDLRPTKVCLSGARAFLARHGHDWDAFVKRGIPAEDLLATGDAIASRVVDAARARVAAERREAE